MMTYSEYTSQHNEMEHQAAQAMKMIEIVRTSQDMPEDRKAAYLSYYEPLVAEYRNKADALRIDYYGTLQHNIYN